MYDKAEVMKTNLIVDEQESNQVHIFDEQRIKIYDQNKNPAILPTLFKNQACYKVSYATPGMQADIEWRVENFQKLVLPCKIIIEKN